MLHFLTTKLASAAMAVTLIFWGVSSTRADMIVSSHNSHEVLRYDDSGAFLGVAASGGPMDSPTGLAFGLGNELYVGNQSTNHAEVLRYDGTTGAFNSVFVPYLSGGLNAPSDIIFGPDGDLLVAGFFNDAVLRYDGTTGAYKGVFASGGGLDAPVGVTFGPGGSLFVVSRGSSEILRYNGLTGAFESRFALLSSQPFDLAFGNDGDLFVTSDVANQVLRYDGTTGAFEGVFASVAGPIGLAIGPGGDLFVSSRGENSVLRFDGATGASKGVFASGGRLDLPSYILFTPATVPEPTSLISAALGLAGLAGYATWRRVRVCTR